VTVCLSPIAGEASNVAEDFDLPLLERSAERILEAVGHSSSELSLVLVDDEAIAQLNSSYRGKNEPTDVLSFSLLEGEQAAYRGALLGDVVISLNTALRQAEQLGQSPDDELARLLIHGVLHLLGYDHVEAAQARRMQAEEERLWKFVRS